MGETVSPVDYEDQINHRKSIGWLSPQLLIQHRVLGVMLDRYISRGILLNPLIQFGRHHTCNTRCPIHALC